MGGWAGAFRGIGQATHDWTDLIRQSHERGARERASALNERVLEEQLQESEDQQKRLNDARTQLVQMLSNPSEEEKPLFQSIARLGLPDPERALTALVNYQTYKREQALAPPDFRDPAQLVKSLQKTMQGMGKDVTEEEIMGLYGIAPKAGTLAQKISDVEKVLPEGQKLSRDELLQLAGAEGKTRTDLQEYMEAIKSQYGRDATPAEIMAFERDRRERATSSSEGLSGEQLADVAEAVASRTIPLAQVTGEKNKAAVISYLKQHNMKLPPQLPASMMTNMMLKESSIEETLGVIGRLRENMDLIKKFRGASLVSLAASHDTLEASLTRLWGFFQSDKERARVAEFVGDMTSLNEWINNIRAPVNATAFRGAPAYNVLLDQTVRAMRLPEINERTLANTADLLTRLQAKTQMLLGEEPTVPVEEDQGAATEAPAAAAPAGGTRPAVQVKIKGQVGAQGAAAPPAQQKQYRIIDPDAKGAAPRIQAQ